MEIGSQNNTFLNETANTFSKTRNSLGFNATVILSEDKDKFAQGIGLNNFRINNLIFFFSFP